MNKFALLLLTSAVVAGCATSQQQIDSHAPAMNSWMGAPIEEFLDVQGAPTAVVDEDNHQVYMFDASKTKRIKESGGSCEPTNFNEPIDEYGQPASCNTYWSTLKLACTYGLVVVENVITDWSIDGNNCKMITIYGRSGQVESGKTDSAEIT